MIWIVIPTHNEQTIMEENLRRLLDFLHTNVHEPWRVVVADNASNDRTRDIVRGLAKMNDDLVLYELPDRGKGRAVLHAWTLAEQCSPSTARGDESAAQRDAKRGGGADSAGNAVERRRPNSEAKRTFDASITREAGATGSKDAPTHHIPLDVYAFMDADLATDLRHIPELIAAIRHGADLAIGSRFAHGASVHRGTFRRAVSLANRICLRAMFNLRVKDAPCGFKAVNERVVRELVPLVENRSWFFDTELLIRAEHADYDIVEFPVSWMAQPGEASLQKVLTITLGNLRAMWKLRNTR